MTHAHLSICFCRFRKSFLHIEVYQTAHKRYAQTTIQFIIFTGMLTKPLFSQQNGSFHCIISLKENNKYWVCLHCFSCSEVQIQSYQFSESSDSRLKKKYS